MLFKIKHLNGIKAGDISLAFRIWKRPRVKKGSIIKTAIGQLEIVDITTIEENQIKNDSAQLSGYDSVEGLKKELEKREGTLYRIEVRYHSVDPRITLRNKTQLSDAEKQTIIQKLNRMDRFSKSGPWTMMVLQAIQQYPQLRAIDLANLIGREKDWLKPNVRKLKNLGLTISHGVGYSLSPLGKVLLDLFETE